MSVRQIFSFISQFHSCVFAYIIFQFMCLEREKMQKIAHDQLAKICLDHKKTALELEATKKELEDREKQLQQRRAQNDSERRKIYHERKMVILLFPS